MLRNQGDDLLANVALTVLLMDREGAMIANAEANLPRAILRPAEEIGFRAQFPGLFGFESATFRARGVGLATRPPETDTPFRAFQVGPATHQAGRQVP